MPSDRPPPPRAAMLGNAFDEVRFGPSRTLNLREQLPTVAQAVAQAEAWLRERQVSRAGEVLVITGRGNGSEGGVSPVREGVRRLLTQLKRRGVITSVHEHTAGSFVVRLAPLAALLDAGRRKRESEPRPTRDPAALVGIERETRQLLRQLAERSLEMLGGHRLDGRFVSDEMARQFTALISTIPDGADREARLRALVRATLDDLEDAD